MTPGDIYRKAYELKAFQIWELVEELAKDWEELFGKKFIKERVTSWIATQVKYKALVKVCSKPPIFAFPEFASNWQLYIRYRTCEICKKPYIPVSPLQKTCSKECKRKHYIELYREYRRPKEERERNKHFLRWSEEEEKLLLQTFPDFKFSKKKAQELSKKLSRTVQAIKRRLYDLKKERCGK